MMMLSLLLTFVVLAHCHTCIHDAMNAAVEPEQRQPEVLTVSDLTDVQRDALGEHFEHMRNKRQAPQWKPLRVKMDYRFLVPSNDPLGLCYQADDWVTLGKPANRNDANPNHQPVCDAECGSKAGGCNCWYQCTNEDILWQQRRDFLELELFPRAVEWLSKALQVRRLPLTLNRPTCGCGNDDLDLGQAREDGKLAGDTYTDYSDHDMVLFVSVRSNRLRGKDTLAYACSCQDDWYGRPVFGHINWGANAVDFVNKDKFNEQLGVALHEITHALGFTSNKYNYYLDNAALEAFLADKPLQWPTDAMLPQQAAPRVPDSLVTKSVTRSVVVNGATIQHAVQLLITENALAKAKAHYQCQGMDGIELENGGSVGTVASHWEKRTMENEFMTGSAAYNPRRSAISLGFFADMGFYRVDFSLADPFTFGRDEGCDFVRPRCDKWAGPYRCEVDQRSHWGCIWDRSARGVCTVVEYQQELDPFFRYFPLKPTFGGSQLSDFCPFFRYDENLNADCTQPLHQGNNLADRAETFSPSSRCLDSNLLSTSKTGLVGSAGCYPLRCRDGQLFVRVLNEYHLCQPNKEVRVAGFNGRLKCPPSVELASLCAQAPQVQSADWPSVSDVSPAGGSFQPDDLITVTGNNLRNVTDVLVGEYKCSDIQGPANGGADDGTSVVCKFGDQVSASGAPAQDSGIFQSVVDFFTTQNQKPADLVDVHVLLGDGLIGTLDNGFDLAGDEASNALIQRPSAALLTITILLGAMVGLSF